MANSELRFHWACSLAQVRPDSRILEIGCGNGMFVEKMAAILDSGKITAIDKSPLQIAKAVQRNQDVIEAGKAHFIETDLKDYEGPLNIFDRVVAFNVNIFLHPDIPLLRKVHSLLNTAGQFILFYQFPHPVDISAADPIIDRMEANRFKLLRKSIKNLDPTPAFCVAFSLGRY